MVWIGGVEQNGLGPSGTQKVGLANSYGIIVNGAFARKLLSHFDRPTSKLARAHYALNAALAAARVA